MYNYNKNNFFKFKKKAGIRLSLWTIIEIILISLITIALFNFISDVKDNSSFKREALSKDISFIVNTIQSIPGDLFFSYSKTILNDFEISFTDNKVLINNIDEKTRISSYPYFNNKKIIKNFEDIKNSNVVTFKKTKNNFNIGANLNLFDLDIVCNNANEKFLSEFKYVDIVNIKNSKKIVDLFLTDFKYINLNNYRLQKSSIDDVNNKYGNLNKNFINILFAIDLVEKNNIDDIDLTIYYFNLDDKNQGLICNFQKEILDLNYFTDVKILPGNNEFYFSGNIGSSYDFSFVIKIIIPKDLFNDEEFINKFETEFSRTLLNSFSTYEK
ncbi:MAG: hypothetical protein ACOC3X_01235 [Nanoarchaeota archaeon]